MAQEGSLIKQIQEVLYSTEDGFEVPDNHEDGELHEVNHGVAELAVDEHAQENDDEVF